MNLIKQLEGFVKGMGEKLYCLSTFAEMQYQRPNFQKFFFPKIFQTNIESCSSGEVYVDQSDTPNQEANQQPEECLKVEPKETEKIKLLLADRSSPCSEHEDQQSQTNQRDDMRHQPDDLLL